ncbi:collagen alpha-3(VI) chain-like, partial [Menidia menidia]
QKFTLFFFLSFLADTDRKDIVFLLDGSDGTRNGFPAMRAFVERVVEKLNVGENKDRLSVVQYSRDAEVHFYLNTYSTREDAVDAVRGLRHKGGRPLNTGAALQYVRENVFTNSSGSRRLRGVPQMLILLTGGRSFDNTDAPASALKQQGVFVIAIGSGTSDARELQKLSYEPSYALSVSDFTDLPSVQEQLSSVMSTAAVRTTPFTPTVTVVRQPAGRDVVFLLDGSDSTRNGFPAMRDFVQRVVETLRVDEGKDRVSVVQYSREPSVQFYLNTYATKGEILDTVRGLRHKGGRPLNTGAALQYLRDNVFAAPAGSRRVEGVPQVLILLSGGRSFDSVDAPASALKEMGVLTFAIGSRGSDSRELQKISHQPSYALSVSEFTELPSVQQQLQASVEAVVIDVTPESPTQKFTLFFFLSFLADTDRKDIVFLLDGSDGTRNGFPAMRAFVERVVEKLNVGENKDRLSVVQYSRDAEVHFYLNTYSTREDAVDAVRGLRHKGGRPLNTGAALQYVRENVFTNSSGSRRLRGVPQMLILLTGGRSFDNTDAPASALKQQGVFVIAIGSGTSDARELQKLSYEPSYALSVSDFTDLPSVQEQLSSVMSTAALMMSCISCFLVVRQPAGRDVVFLLDGSDSTRNGFPAMRDFVQRVVETLRVDEGKDRVSVVQYSREPSVQFYLNTYATKGEILDTVRGLRHKGGRPLNTGAALQYLRDNVFAAPAGSRRVEGVPQVLILLSGGRSFDSVDAPASALKEMGVLTFAIGSRGSDSRELQKISHQPSYALSVSEFTELPSVQQQLQASVEAVVIDVTPESPTVLGTSSNMDAFWREESADWFQTPARLEIECGVLGGQKFTLFFFLSFLADTDRKDIVFLLDGSDGTRNGFPAIRAFVERVVEKLNVGENKDRLSVVQYSRDAEVHFYLNTYRSREDAVDAVRGLRHKGGRPLNTGAALQYVRENVFTNSSGSRRLQGVAQMLILLTGGRSFDNTDAPASALKQQGVFVIAIGSGTSDARELQKLSYEPSYALSVSDFTDLPSVQEQLSSVMSTAAVRATPFTPTVTVVRQPAGRDVVFLLDGSDSTRNGFPAMRDFVQRVVETLRVDEGKDRVSVVQYSREPSVQFYLNTYATKGEILDTVRGLRHKGGRPLNTGAALQYLRDNVFAAPAGSRRLEGVPQVLILLSSGRSFDSVDAPASALKEMGVLTFAIGSRGSDSRELQKISHQPSYALSVSEFTELPSVQQQLQASVEAVVIDVTPESPTQKFTLFFFLSFLADTDRKDIVFLLDGSDGTRNGFPAMRAFVERVVEKLNVGENKDRLSVVQYSRDAEVHFYLNTYSTREDAVDAVRGLRHKGGRPLNTGAALQYVRENVFTNSSGSRRLQGVPQMLILLTGGRSFDNTDAPASALKQQGVFVIAIGSGTSDARELQKLSYEPSYALSVSDFTDLPSVQEQLSSVMSTVAVRATPFTPTVTGK